jgi:hypothetical protein
MDVGAEDEFISVQDGGGTRFTFRYVLVSPHLSLLRLFRETVFDDTPLKQPYVCLSTLSLPFPVQLH